MFVEVKTIRQNNSAIAELNPEDNLTAEKLQKLKRTTQIFAGSRQSLVDDKTRWRLDLLAIYLTSRDPKITHYENI